ncbi:MAG: hypothetical protein JNN24_17880 [Hyphomicrobium zavarzinii]|uniref:hypothetical protein n=1 Tax=Hyphomicrobium zavarzinii TaxID=48292 RepID=UPI001A38E5B5|nr:hypothetical protein [Hyphomicrobium zavarzinii]MBL8847636.1 hypothetical protein [Hyphomicrobium zavarzinii]
MPLLLRSLAAALLLAGSAHAQDIPAEVPPASNFAPGSGRVWFSSCTFEAERYVSCKDAARPAIEAIAKPGDGTPGEALQAFVKKLFTDKGCTFDAPPESFRVNGIFLSFDSKAAHQIACQGQKADLVFKPGVIILLNTLYFVAGDPPQ